MSRPRSSSPSGASWATASTPTTTLLPSTWIASGRWLRRRGPPGVHREDVERRTVVRDGAGDRVPRVADGPGEALERRPLDACRRPRARAAADPRRDQEDRRRADDTRRGRVSNELVQRRAGGVGHLGLLVGQRLVELDHGKGPIAERLVQRSRRLVAGIAAGADEHDRHPLRLEPGLGVPRQGGADPHPLGRGIHTDDPHLADPALRRRRPGPRRTPRGAHRPRRPRSPSVRRSGCPAARPRDTRASPRHGAGVPGQGLGSR